MFNATISNIHISPFFLQPAKRKDLLLSSKMEGLVVLTEKATW
jgi:hypothetical protein